jgi:hypothetical protein
MLPNSDKWINVTPPVALINTASALTTTIDTLGYDYCQVVVALGVLNIALTALKVQESDLANMSGGADVTGLVFGTSTNIAGSASVLPLSTADNTLLIFDIDLRARKRYLDLIATGGIGDTYLSAVARLSRAEQAPTTAAGRGAGDVLQA